MGRMDFTEPQWLYKGALCPLYTEQRQSFYETHFTETTSLLQYFSVNTEELLKFWNLSTFRCF